MLGVVVPPGARREKLSGSCAGTPRAWPSSLVPSLYRRRAQPRGVGLRRARNARPADTRDSRAKARGVAGPPAGGPPAPVGEEPPCLLCPRRGGLAAPRER